MNFFGFININSCDLTSSFRCIQLKLGILILCVLQESIPKMFCIYVHMLIKFLIYVQMIASGFLIFVIGIYLISGVLLADENLLMLGGAFTMFSLFIVLLLACAEFGFALYAFSDIRKAEPLGIRYIIFSFSLVEGQVLRLVDLILVRYYYMFKLVSLGFSLFVFILTTTWTTPEILNLLISVLFSLYCIWCIWSLHEALMLGGEAAAKAGFTPEEVSCNHMIFLLSVLPLTSF